MSNSIDIDHDWNGKALLHLAFWPSPVRISGPRETGGPLVSFLCNPVPRRRVGKRLSRAGQASTVHWSYRAGLAQSQMQKGNKRAFGLQ